MQQQAPQRRKAEQNKSQKQGVYSFFDKKRGFGRRHAGFSLIELLVVISIIGLLLAIGVGVALKMSAEARRVQTREMMQGMLSANDQYKAIRQGSNISHTGPTAGLSSTEQYVAACLSIKTCEEIMLSAINSSISTTLDRIYKNGSVFDRWGTEIEYRSQNDGTGTGPQTGVSNSDLPTSRDPFFASAGPDKVWGTDDDITTLQQ